MQNKEGTEVRRLGLEPASHQLPQLPTDFNRPQVASLIKERECINVPAALNKEVRKIAAGEGVSEALVLLAAFAVFLYRYTQQQDMVFGTCFPFDAQGCVDADRGFEVRPIRIGLDDALSSHELIRKTAKALVESTHATFSEGGVEAPGLSNASDLAGRPFSVAFLTNELVYDQNTAQCDLILYGLCRERGAQIDCVFNPQLFELETIQRWLANFQVLLKGLCDDPRRPISELPLLAATECRRLLVEWNETAVHYPQHLGVHHLFEAQAQRTPSAKAVVFEDRSLTYRELDEQADRLAHYLRSLGVSRNRLVGVHLQRSPEMLIAVLGILKAGGGYVPLDPSYPPSRIVYMIEDSGLSLIITESALAENLSEIVGRKILLDEDAATIFSRSSAKSTADFDSTSLAYVIYTSGSTGQPKGVEITHRSVVNFLNAMKTAPGIRPHDVLFAVTTLSFDISVLELLLPLTVGARVVIASQRELSEPDLLIEKLGDSGATIAQATPAFWSMLIGYGWRPERRIKILCGGEPLTRDLADKLRPRATSLWNMYGPTETTIWSTCCEITRDQLPISVGRPIANTQTYILDPKLQPVPIGVTGEVYIGGDGLASGYLQRPQLTEERFINSPFTPDARLYKTGDLARYLPDGHIYLLGRADQQVKIRGFRIEIGEVESVLSQSPELSEVAVTVREDSGDSQRYLAAYMVSKNGQPAVADLRRYLRERVPEYMVPSSFDFLDTLPRTPNGKIDRNALPSPKLERSNSVAVYLAPADSMELHLTKLWEKLLGVRPIGLNDDFFDLGGHSLLATRLVIAVEDVYGKRLPIATLFKAPTIRQMAEVLRAEKWSLAWSSLVPIRAGGSKAPLFLMHSHGGNVLEYQPLSRQLGDNQPVYALQSAGLNGDFETDVSIEKMAGQYLREMQRLQPEGPYLLGGFCFGGLLAIEAAQQLQRMGEEVALVALLQCATPSCLADLGKTTNVQRFAYRARLEWARLSTTDRATKWSHILNRARRLRDIAGARMEMSIKPVLSRLGLEDGHYSHAYVHEKLRLKHDLAERRYQPVPYSGKVVIFSAREQPRGKEPDVSLGWAKLVKQLTIHEIDGFQQTMLEEPNVTKIAQQLECHIDACFTTT